MLPPGTRISKAEFRAMTHELRCRRANIAGTANCEIVQAMDQKWRPSSDNAWKSASYSQLPPARPRAIKSFRQAKAIDARRDRPSSWNQFHAAPLERRFLRGRDAAKAGGAAMTILKWALIFLVVSIIAGILGFTGISAASADIARFLFYVFVVIFLVLLILGLTIFRA